MTRTQRRKFIESTAVATSLAVAGCLGSIGLGGSDDDNTITYLTDRTEAEDALEMIVESFEDEYPEYEVDLVIVPEGEDQDEEIQARMAAGDPPDVLWSPETDAYRLQQEGHLAPIEGLFDTLDIPDPVNVDGDPYLASGILNPITFWYRTDVYEDDPATWDSWHEEAMAVTEETDLEGIAMPTGRTNIASSLAVQYLWNNDVEIYQGPSDGIEVILDDGDNYDRAVETFEWIEEISEASPEASGWGWGETINSLTQEQTAAIPYVAGYVPPTLESDNPDLVDDVKPTLHPAAGPDRADRLWAWIEGHMIWDTADTTAAQTFVEYFHTSDDFIEFHLNSPLSYIPPTPELINSEEYMDHELVQNNPEYIDLILDNLESYTPYLATGTDGAPNLAAAQEYNEQLLGDATDRLVVGDLSPEETVEHAAESIRELL